MMINIDDIQESMAQSEGILLQTLAFKLTQGDLGGILGQESHVYTFLEGSQAKVLGMLYSYYTEDNGVGIKAKRQIFEQILDQHSRQGHLSTHKSLLKPTTSSLQTTHTNSQDLRQWETRFTSLKRDNPQLYDKLRKSQMESLRAIEVIRNVTRKKEQENTPLLQENVDLYIEKTMEDLLSKCRQYEAKVAQASRLTNEVVLPQSVSLRSKKYP